MTEHRAGDFDPQAEAYVRARPGYPPALVERLIAQAELRPGDGVADVGAGTGLFTALLAGRGWQVSAVEPSAEMRARAPELPDVTWRDGTFEHTGLVDAGQRWVVAAQAFHWARHADALPEMRRILEDGGRFTVLWNVRDAAASELVAFTHAAIERRAPDFDEGYRFRDWPAVLTSTGHFRDPVEVTAGHVVVMDAARYRDLWRSHNVLHARVGDAGVHDLLAELEPRLAGLGRIEVPYLCRSWTALKV